MRLTPFAFLVLPAAVGSVIACSSDTVATSSLPDAGSETSIGTPDSGNADAADEVQTIKFQARIGADAFGCSKMGMGLGTTAAMLEPLDFRVYVHDVRLVLADGTDVPFTLSQDGMWQYQNLALLDFEDKTGTCANGTVETNTVLRGKAPAGKYNGIKFKIGVPFALNHSDVATAPSPLNLSGLFWNWNDGYKFARIDARVAMAKGDAGMSMNDAGDGGMVMPAETFFIHLGSTGCSAGPDGGVAACGKPNIGEVSLSGFDPFQKTILADYKALVAGNDLTRNGGGAPGCMSGDDDPECPAILTHLGVNSATGEPNAVTQALFRVE